MQNRSKWTLTTSKWICNPQQSVPTKTATIWKAYRLQFCNKKSLQLTTDGGRVGPSLSSEPKLQNTTCVHKNTYTWWKQHGLHVVSTPVSPDIWQSIVQNRTKQVNLQRSAICSNSTCHNLEGSQIRTLMEKCVQLKTDRGSCSTLFVFKTQNLKSQDVYIENIHGEHIKYCMRQVLKSLRTLIDHGAKQETVNSDDKQVIHL